MRQFRFSLLFPAFLLGGCLLGPEHQPPEFTHPADWQSELALSTELTEAGDTAWWKQFNDPILNRLITETAANNRDLAAAMANIEQARALRRTISADALPQVDLSAGADRSRYSRQSAFGATSGTRNSFDAGLDASWELDLFGRVRRSIQASDARIEAEIEVLHGLQLSLLAETATAYFELRSLQAQLANTERTIELLKEVEAIARAQAEAGAISEMDLLRARGERQNLQSQLPELHTRITARIHRISVLNGRPPEHYLTTLQTPGALPEPTDRVPLGLRSDLLQRRPDIRRAERLLAATTADIGVAKAEMLPSFSLTGAIGSSARTFGDLFTAGTITNSVGAALGWPLFAAGKYSARVGAAEAAQRAAMAGYEQQVLLALEDTENALLGYGQEWKTLNHLREVLQSRKQAFAIARLRYEAGEDSFLNMIDAERSLTTTRTDLILSEERLLIRLATLYKALGGEWPAD